MTSIGQLFVELLFKVTGASDLQAAEQNLKGTAMAAGKAALGVDAAVVAMGALVNSALNSSVAFHKFALTTGLSSDELQQWQYRAAMANVSAQEVTRSIEGIQAAKGKVAYGNADGLQAWTLLGLSPLDDPFKILTKLQSKMQEFAGSNNIARGRFLMNQAGFSDDMFQMLRRAPVQDLPQRYVMHEADLAKMDRLNDAWTLLPHLIGKVKDKFSSDLAPALTDVLVLLGKAVDVGARFVNWLSGTTGGAATARGALVLLGGALVALSLAMTAITGASAFLLWLLSVRYALEYAAAAAAGFNLAILPMIGITVALAFAVWKLVGAYQALKDIWAMPKNVPLHFFGPSEEDYHALPKRGKRTAGQDSLRAAGLEGSFSHRPAGTAPRVPTEAELRSARNMDAVHDTTGDVLTRSLARVLGSIGRIPDSRGGSTTLAPTINLHFSGNPNATEVKRGVLDGLNQWSIAGYNQPARHF